MPKIIAIGESLYDIFFREGQPTGGKAGGSMLNTAVSLGRLKLPVYLVSELGNDPVGHIIYNFLQQNGVNTSYIQLYDAVQTPLALAFLDEDHNASYRFYKETFPGDIQFPEVERGDIILLGSFYATAFAIRDSLKNFLLKAKEKNAVILYDPNFRPSAHKNPEEVISLIKENLGYASLLKASDEDMWHIFQVKNGKSAYEKVRKMGIPWFIYTLNKDGALLYTPQKELSFPSWEIQPVSTIGAGDGFNAGLMYGLYRQHVTHNGLSRLTDTDWYTMLNLAIMFAAHVCLQTENYILQDFADNLIHRGEAGPYT